MIESLFQGDVAEGTGTKAPASVASRERDVRRQKEDLKIACQQFEGVLLAMLWKDMMRSCRKIGNDEKRPFGPLEDTAVEMATASLSESGGVGLWRVLYEQLQETLPAEKETPVLESEFLPRRGQRG